jgi:hypothetical protein
MYLQITNYYNIAALFWFKWKLFSSQLAKTQLLQYLLIPSSIQQLNHIAVTWNTVWEIALERKLSLIYAGKKSSNLTILMEAIPLYDSIEIYVYLCLDTAIVHNSNYNLINY